VGSGTGLEMQGISAGCPTEAPPSQAPEAILWSVSGGAGWWQVHRGSPTAASAGSPLLGCASPAIGPGGLLLEFALKLGRIPKLAQASAAAAAREGLRAGS
jgi:hypothetical protein